jgi:hypothetical protein
MKHFSPPKYDRDELLRQVRLWREGISIHNQINGECCPDFSCCYPDMLTPEVKRREWADRIMLQHAGVSI